MLEEFQTVSDPASLLKRDGYLVLENHLDAARLRTVCDELAPHFEAVPFGRGAFYGGETKRFGRALSRSRSAASLVLDRTASSRRHKRLPSQTGRLRNEEPVRRTLRKDA